MRRYALNLTEVISNGPGVVMHSPLHKSLLVGGADALTLEKTLLVGRCRNALTPTEVTSSGPSVVMNCTPTEAPSSEPGIVMHLLLITSSGPGRCTHPYRSHL